MPTILVVDDTAFCRDLISAAMESKGYCAVAAKDGQEALKAMDTARPDVVILDITMPLMGGIPFLETIRAQTKWKSTPVIVLSEVIEKNAIMRARDLGVQDYLLKSTFTLPDMLSRVQRLLTSKRTKQSPSAPAAAMPASPVAPARPVPSGPKPAAASAEPHPQKAAAAPPSDAMTRAQTLAGIEDFSSIKALAGGIAQVVALSAAPTASVTETAGIVRQDPVLSARLLQVANSAAFATAAPARQRGEARIATIEEAVRNLGNAQVRTIAMGMGAFETASTGPGSTSLLRCWQHSFAVAAILDRVVPRSDGSPSGLPHVIGLCHDLGEIVMRQRYGEHYERAAATVAVTGRPFREAHQLAFGLTPSELMTELSKSLKLPEQAAIPILAHLSRVDDPSLIVAAARARSGPPTSMPVGDDGPAKPPPLTASQAALASALRLADLYANGLLLASSGNALIEPVTAAECRAAMVSPIPLKDNDLRAETMTSISMLAQASGGEPAKAFEPLFAQRSVKVWYVRHPSFAPFDPIESALKALAVVTTSDHLPGRGDDIATIYGIVVAAPRMSPSPLSIVEVDVARRQMKRELPILHISGPGDDPTTPSLPGIEGASFPLTLSKLADFVRKL